MEKHLNQNNNESHIALLGTPDQALRELHSQEAMAALDGKGPTDPAQYKSLRDRYLSTYGAYTPITTAEQAREYMQNERSFSQEDPKGNLKRVE